MSREILIFPIGETQALSVFGAGDRPLLSFLPPGSSDVQLFSAAVVAQDDQTLTLNFSVGRIDFS